MTEQYSPGEKLEAQERYEREQQRREKELPAAEVYRMILPFFRANVEALYHAVLGEASPVNSADKTLKEVGLTEQQIEAAVHGAKEEVQKTIAPEGIDKSIEASRQDPQLSKRLETLHNFQVGPNILDMTLAQFNEHVNNQQESLLS